jgi:hypothetical protein
MGFGINLRGDLAKFDDAEMAARFEALISERAALDQRNSTYFGSGWFRFHWGLLRRGLFHARIFYKIQGLAFLFVTQVLSLQFDFAKSSSFYEVYLCNCELKDVRDEIERRVRRAKGQRVVDATS